MARSAGTRTIEHRQATIAALTIGAAATGVWVWLTAANDLTYHLFPFGIALAAPAAARYVSPQALQRLTAAVSAALGVAGVLAGWAVLAAIDQWPSSTFLEDQPGGVEGETILFAVLSTVAGVRYATRR